MVDAYKLGRFGFVKLGGKLRRGLVCLGGCGGPSMTGCVRALSAEDLPLNEVRRWMSESGF